MKIDYVICTYSGVYNRKFKDTNSINNKSQYLNKNLSLFSMFKNKITNITIMKPKVNKDHQKIKNYYNNDNINENTRKIINIQKCKNVGISYGQFLTHIYIDYITDNMKDYYIFSEDDYIPFSDNWDKIFIDNYQENSFLCLGKNIDFNNIEKEKTYKDKSFTLPDFSIGIISKNTIKKIFEKIRYDDILILFREVEKEAIHINQIVFGYILHISDIKSFDLKQKYLSLFYEAADDNLYLVNYPISDRRYNHKNIIKKYENPLFIPIDILYSEKLQKQLIQIYINLINPIIFNTLCCSIINKDLLIISNSCVGWDVHKKIYKNTIYGSPFIGTLIFDDIQYLKLCNNITHYMDIEPVVNCNSDYGKKYIHKSIKAVYPIIHLDDIEIHCIHEEDPKIAMDKYNRRRLRFLETISKNNYLIINLMTFGELFNDHENIDLYIEKFLQIKNDNIISLFIGPENKSIENKSYIKTEYCNNKSLIRDSSGVYNFNDQIFFSNIFVNFILTNIIHFKEI
jgi:hypothetical protein